MSAMSFALPTNPNRMLVVSRICATAEAIADNARKGPHSLTLVAPQAQPEPQPAVNAPARSVRAIPKPQLAFYRKYTETMLHRYMTMSLEAARVPSLMGRELFKGNVSHRRVTGFDDVVIYVHDVGKMIARLSPGLQHLVRRIAIQGYSQPETAALLGIGLRTVTRHYADALDQLTAMFIEADMLDALRLVAKESTECGKTTLSNSCQGVEVGQRESSLTK
jgi:hypothetical protein